MTGHVTPPYTRAELADLIRSNGGMIRMFVDTGMQPEWAPPELAVDIEALNAVIEQLGPHFERIATACGYNFDIEDRGGMEEVFAERENALAAELEQVRRERAADDERTGRTISLLSERVGTLLVELEQVRGERDEARELAAASLDILRNVSDEPMRELFGLDDMGELPGWFTGYGPVVEHGSAGDDASH